MTRASVGRSKRKKAMRIKTTYRQDDETYIIEAGEQQIVVPATSMGRFLVCVETALYRQRLANNQAKAEKARKLIEQANHPAILPFTAEKPEPPPEIRLPGRPKGIHTPKSRLKPKPPPKPPKPPKDAPPFKYIPFR